MGLNRAFWVGVAALAASAASAGETGDHAHDHDHDHAHSDDGGDETRSAAAHVHGLAHLGLAVDGDILSVQLDSAFYNLVGFEHAPETAEQKLALAQAAAALADPAVWLGLPAAAGCTLTHSDLGALAPWAGGDQAHDDHAEHAAHDDHDDHADHGDHDHHEADHHHDEAGDEAHDEAAHDHDHGDHDHGDEGHGHKDAHLTYELTCAEPAALDAADVTLFANFPNLEEIEAVALTDAGQSNAALKPASARFTLP